jgi:hypothetical protein
MKKGASPEFQAAFDAAFSPPSVESERARELLLWDLDVVSEALKGPMSRVLNEGNHDYVYRNEDGRFPGVVDAASFRAWAISVGQHYERLVRKFAPQTPEEVRDREILLRIAASMRKVVDAAEREVRRRRAEESHGE